MDETERTVHCTRVAAICQIQTYFNTKTVKRFAANAPGDGSLMRLQR